MNWVSNSLPGQETPLNRISRYRRRNSWKKWQRWLPLMTSSASLILHPICVTFLICEVLLPAIPVFIKEFGSLPEVRTSGRWNSVVEAVCCAGLSMTCMKDCRTCQRGPQSQCLKPLLSCWYCRPLVSFSFTPVTRY